MKGSFFVPDKGGRKHSIPFRRQKMQIDELVPPPSTSGYPVSQPDDPYVADLLRLADGRCVFHGDSPSASLADVCVVHLSLRCFDIFPAGFMSYRKI